ncbi:hypothetical protein [Tolumonas auensis]|uniref:hypothetical protein n=1 Tax=Tolumonas auensis TaxID=43948 RepID=UPI0011D09D65|nr:hypothetical protein [Tolumonas auensis]
MTTPTLDNLILPDDVVWTDELDFSPVAQTITPTLTGAIIVEENAVPAGRPITLKGIATLALVKQLKTTEALINHQMPLVLSDGQTKTVIFKRPGVSANSLIGDVSDPDINDPYEFTLNLMEVAV